MTKEEDTAPAGPANKETKKPDRPIPPPKPKLTKAERRALQEQQRAAKQGPHDSISGGRMAPGAGGTSPGATVAGHKTVPAASTFTAATNANANATTTTTTTTTTSTTTTGDETEQHADSKMVALVSHLTPYQDPTITFQSGATLQLQVAADSANLHPAVVQLGYQYAAGTVRGGNHRCRAMLQCFMTVLRDFEPPSDCTDVRHVLDNVVFKPAFHYWSKHCRPHSVGMGNAFSFVKAAVASLDRECPYPQMQAILQDTLQAFCRERMEYADQAIAAHAVQKLYAREVILTFGHAQVVVEILELAAATKSLLVIVVDSRPLLEGRIMLRKLRAAGIECTYILLNALTYVIQDVTKVLLGASALMSDGSVLGRVGTACVALAAHTQHIPVLVCSETYKISNRVQLEALTGNELGNPADVSSETLKDWKETDNLKLLNLVYDLTPASFVSGIVTEFGIVPPTSVAVLLREMNPQDFKGYGDL